VFATIQTTGCILASYGTVYSESAFVRGSWLVGFLILLPGNLPAMAAGQTFIHVRPAYIFFPIAITCNAMIWIVCSTLWRTLRHATPRSGSHIYGVSLAATGLVFVIANTIHFLRPAMCADCFFPYGLPFTLYHEGGYAGGAGFVWGGLAADVGCVLGVALLVGRIWEQIVKPRISA
jgi:hypothetical protein